MHHEIHIHLIGWLSNRKGESYKDSPLVRVAGFEPTASWSRTTRATNCAIPGSVLYFSCIPKQSGNYYTEFSL